MILVKYGTKMLKKHTKVVFTGRNGDFSIGVDTGTVGYVKRDCNGDLPSVFFPIKQKSYFVPPRFYEIMNPLEDDKEYKGLFV